MTLLQPQYFGNQHFENQIPNKDLFFPKFLSIFLNFKKLHLVNLVSESCTNTTVQSAPNQILVKYRQFFDRNQCFGFLPCYCSVHFSTLSLYLTWSIVRVSAVLTLVDFFLFVVKRVLFMVLNMFALLLVGCFQF